MSESRDHLPGEPLSVVRGNPDIGRHSAKAARRSAQRRRRLTLPEVEQELGALDTPQDAQRWLRQAYVWAAGGLVPGTVASAMVRAAEVWLKAHDMAQVAGRIRELEQLVADLRRPRG